MLNGYSVVAPGQTLRHRFEAPTLIASLEPKVRDKITALSLFDVIDSTNDHLLAKGAPGKGFALCIAGSQNKGRGRRGRIWVSPAGGNIYLSLAWRKRTGYRCDGWLGLMAALELSRCLSNFVPSFVGVKWPNDIYCEGHKLGGVLTEKVGSLYVVGLGLNIVTHEMQLDGRAGKHISLQDIGVDLSAYPYIVAAIISEMIRAIEFVAAADVERMQNLYRPFDLTYGRSVRVLTTDGDFTGTAAGVDGRGLLRVDTAAGVKLCASAETSIRL